jgi:hypothetical protein
VFLFIRSLVSYSDGIDHRVFSFNMENDPEASFLRSIQIGVLYLYDIELFPLSSILQGYDKRTQHLSILPRYSSE